MVFTEMSRKAAQACSQFYTGSRRLWIGPAQKRPLEKKVAPYERKEREYGS